MNNENTNFNKVIHVPCGFEHLVHECVVPKDTNSVIPIKFRYSVVQAISCLHSIPISGNFNYRFLVTGINLAWDFHCAVNIIVRVFKDKRKITKPRAFPTIRILMNGFFAQIFRKKKTIEMQDTENYLLFSE